MRATEKEILTVQAYFNSILKHRGIQVRMGKRYGYKAFDLYHTKEKGGGMIETLKAGFTSRQALDYLRALIKGIELISWGA